MKGLQLSKLTLAVALAGYGVSAVAAVEDAGHINLGPVEMTPMATLGMGYDDNVFREGGDKANANKGSAVYKLDASAAFKAQQGLSTYEATLAAKNTSFSSESDANYIDYGMTGKIHQDFNSRNRLDVDFDLGRYHDDGSTISTINKEAPEYTRTKGGLKYGFGSMEAMFRTDLFGNYSKQKYQETNGDPEGNNRKSTEYGATGYYRFMPKTDALIEIKQRELDYTDADKDGYDVTSYLVGLNWEATAKTSGYVKVGRRERDSKNANTSSDSSSGWEVGVSYMPVDHSVFQLSTSKDYGFDSEDPSATNPLFTDGITSSLNWNHQWTSKISTNAKYSLTKEDIVDGDGATQKDRTINQFGISADWKVMRNATVSLSYDLTDRDESNKVANGGAESYKRNAYMLTGTIAL
ncbi:outer membrane beta-barrel protein [Endozoicomonas acroporae]|uniref:outer membrane beta-barrel protein n=1 Tax=Endozoicomonas acroporae TaxID=1701104 RepID=UPI000C75E34D|nr:outer membrane beta-barrel protein [Endozoicomonas acroporae]